MDRNISKRLSLLLLTLSGAALAAISLPVAGLTILLWGWVAGLEGEAPGFLRAVLWLLAWTLPLGLLIIAIVSYRRQKYSRAGALAVISPLSGAAVLLALELIAR